jgi:hypothetical protein
MTAPSLQTPRSRLHLVGAGTLRVMQRFYFETVNALNWGKFMICQFEGADFAERSVVDDITFQGLLDGQGWGPDHLLVFDLATGEGALFRPGGLAAADLMKHKIWVCPMFEPFLEWLYEQDLSDLSALPRRIELPEAPMAAAGYRRPGPGLTIDAVRERLANYVPCICGPEYTERNLEDPACRFHDAMDAIDSLAEERTLEPERP